ncbi:MAG TPA: efflux RND transporter periplasmic adaptor subunit [Bryobacteraceae bacterium]|jgi:multidrug efflux pump subunit AcrA (membrane-fusion protein)|nr:efflux RND transporter periplasmic adaptor subunit [Bryobacteraceae bacterium]
MRRKILWTAGIIVLAGGAGYLIAAKQQRPRATPDRRAPGTAIAATGVVDRTLRLAGQTSARMFTNVVAPKQTGPDSGNELILVKLVDPGTMVHKGQLIAEIDAQSLKDHLDDISDTIRQAKADVVKRKAEQEAEWATFEQTLLVAKADLDKAKLDARTTPLLTEIERELLQLSVEEAAARYKELQKEAALRRQSNEAEIRILEITATRHERHHERHSVDLSRFTIYSPMNGLAVMQPIWRDGEMGQVRRGDRVRPGQLFMKIADTSTMQVEAYANQAESGEVRVGQKAEVRLDAFPGLEFTGHVESIGALATTSGWRQNYYIRRVPVRVTIDGHDPRLIPDLSASADILLGQSEPSVVVPLGAVHKDGNGNTLYVKDGERFVQRAVTLGLADNTSVAVTSGLRSGEQVRVN